MLLVFNAAYKMMMADSIRLNLGPCVVLAPAEHARSGTCAKLSYSCWAASCNAGNTTDAHCVPVPGPRLTGPRDAAGNLAIGRICHVPSCKRNISADDLTTACI